MDKETLARCCDPFFSTKLQGRGMGLPAVLGIVRSHDGGIEIISQEGVGTTFRIYLPRTEQPPSPRTPPRVPK
jgi:nitrogen-specific signal transduction histidine kinase